MGYVVDLTLIMQAVFQASLEHQEGIVEQQRVEQIADRFNKSEKKNSIHMEIKSFASHQNPFAKDTAVLKIEALITQNRDFSLWYPHCGLDVWMVTIIVPQRLLSWALEPCLYMIVPWMYDTDLKRII